MWSLQTIIMSLNFISVYREKLLAGVCRSDLYLVFLRFILNAGIIKSESRGTITRLLLRKHL